MDEILIYDPKSDIELQLIHKKGCECEYQINIIHKDKIIECISCMNDYGAHKMFIQLQIDYFDKVYFDNIK